MKNFYSFTKNEALFNLQEIGLEGFRAKLVWSWVYDKGITSFEQITNLSKQARNSLVENFSLIKPSISSSHKSTDGTCKWLVKFFDGREVEMVYIPENTRATLCISSQIGCSLSCKFCHTGTQTLVRNLEFHEIVAQILTAKDLLSDWDKSNRRLTNLVFMGMGEPFFNFENVAKAIEILNDPDGLDYSRRKIVVSTSGLVPEILRCASEMKVNLAVSLHAPTDSLRCEIMAINKRYPLVQLLSACKSYNHLNPGQKITFEYLMLKGVNDSTDHANQLVELICRYNLNVKINLIPFNSWAGCDYESSSIKQISEFQEVLKSANLVSTIRKTRGDDVLGACGQLKSLSIRVKKSKNF